MTKELPRKKPYLVITVTDHNSDEFIKTLLSLLVDHGIFMSHVYVKAEYEHEIHVWHDIDFNDWEDYNDLVVELEEIKGTVDWLTNTRHDHHVELKVVSELEETIN